MMPFDKIKLQGASYKAQVKTASVCVLVLVAILILPLFASAQVTYREKDKKCMEECHAKPGFHYNPVGNWGNLKPMQVNYEKFLNSKHGIFYCVDCHIDADAGEKTHFVKVGSAKCESCHIDSKLYSEEIKKLFASKQIKMEDKKRVSADYAESAHGKAYYEKKRNAPYCAGCHNPHNANRSDKDSPVGRGNLSATCGKCHPDNTIKEKGLFSKLALYRINGHKKGDPSVDYSYGNCIGCHQGDAAHGKKITEQKCMSCHKNQKSLLFADFHGKHIPVLSILLNFGLLIGLIFVVGIWVFYRGGNEEVVIEPKEKGSEHEH
jgi:hypothetical protein